MTDFKPWYASRTIWGSLIAVLAALGSAVGFELDTQSQAELADAALQIVTVAASLFAVLGRLNAKSMIE